jgi:glutathione S-transferase
MYTLYIANKTYSSWSLRGWLCAKLSGAPFQTIEAPLGGKQPNPAYLAFSPGGLVPCLHDGDVVVWESLAIAEYLAEKHAGMWPEDSKARAFARSACSEMHAGFRALRNDMTMCIRERLDVTPWSDAVKQDIARIEAIWTEARRKFGTGGPCLFGKFSIGDAFFAPVAFRFQSYYVHPRGEAGDYLRSLLDHPWLREWEAAAARETQVIEEDEPRIIYRDKLLAQGRL